MLFAFVTCSLEHMLVFGSRSSDIKCIQTRKNFYRIKWYVIKTPAEPEHNQRREDAKANTRIVLCKHR